jgi:hypothetical protein
MRVTTVQKKWYENRIAHVHSPNKEKERPLCDDNEILHPLQAKKHLRIENVQREHNFADLCGHNNNHFRIGH